LLCFFSLHFLSYLYILSPQSKSSKRHLLLLFLKNNILSTICIFKLTSLMNCYLLSPPSFTHFFLSLKSLSSFVSSPLNFWIYCFLLILSKFYQFTSNTILHDLYKQSNRRKQRKIWGINNIVWFNNNSAGFYCLENVLRD